MIIPTRLPSAYQEVEYIETSDGTSAYIDTGFTTNTNMKIEIDAQALGNSELFLGAMPISGSENSNFTIGRVNNTMGYLCWNNQHYYGNYGDWSTRSKVVAYQDSYIHYTFNGTDYAFSIISPAIERTSTLYLFRRNDGGTPSSVAASKIRLFGCKLWSGDTLSRDFVPCYRRSDSEIGLYDLVNNTFYTNAGTGTFTKGADVGVTKINLNPRIPTQYQELDFIQSTGYEYINTGVCIYDYYDKIKMEVDMQLTPGVVQNEYCYQGVGYAGSSGYYFTVPGFWTGNNNIDVSIGNSNYANSGHAFVNARDTNRHKIYVDTYNGECGFDNDIYTGLEYSSISSGLGSGDINLFAIRSNGYDARNFIKMCLYGCTITDMSTNTKLRDFVPCYRVSDGVVGLYDLVTETFFTNQGNGEFIKGEEKSVFQIEDANGNVLWRTSEEVEFGYEHESSPHYADQGGDCLFDGNPDTKWCANFTNGMNVYFHTNRLIIPKSYSLMTGGDTASYPGRNPISWKLYGKARMNEAYTLIDSRTNDYTMGATNKQWYDFTISNPDDDRYRYFYIEVNAIASGSILQIAELKIEET